MAGGGGAQKVDDFQPHPIKDQLPGVDFCVTSSPPWPEAILLGFQHFLVMLGTTVIIPTILVPLMGGGDVEKAEVIETLLFVAGINTLLQTVFGTRLPIVMGGSYAFIIPAVSIALSRRFSVYIDPHQRFKQTMRAIQGAVIVASFFQMILGFLGFVRIFGRSLSPLSAVPLVTLTGLGFFVFGFPQVTMLNPSLPYCSLQMIGITLSSTMSPFPTYLSFSHPICSEKMDAFDSVVDPLREFSKDSIRLVQRCHKPNRKEFTKVALRTAIGFVVMGFVGSS